MSKGDAIGMMEGAYFVGRGELLTWLNELLELNYTKVEQVASGAAHCQVMDAIYPGFVPLSKVDFNAKFDYEFVKNYKVLQTVFDKKGIDRYIDVNKLIKGKYQDNLEFLQWIKKYYDTHNPGTPYNARERRQGAKVEYEGDKENKPAPSAAAPLAAAPSAVKQTTVAPKVTKVAKPAAPKAGGVSKPAARVAPAKKPTVVDTEDPASPSVASSENEAILEAKVDELSTLLKEQKLNVKSLEGERDFYFNKLREIEILCQNCNESLEIVDDIKRVLYASDEDCAAPDEHA